MAEPRLRERYRGLLQRQLDDLPSLAWAQCVFLTLAMLCAKGLAIRQVFTGASLGVRGGAFLRSIPVDLLTAAAGFGLAALSRLLPAPHRVARGLVAGAIVLGQIVLALALFADLAFFASWGSPLTPQLVRLAPAMAPYILVAGVSDKLGILATGAAFAGAGLLLGPWLAATVRERLARPRVWRAAWLVPVSLTVVGGVLLGTSPREYREAALRQLSLVAMVAGEREAAPTAAQALPEDRAALARLLGPSPDLAPARALAALPRRPRNVVVWVWESVGARYLRSFHSQGVVATPNLDRVMGRGAVEFSNAYAECPLTIQTTWALVTGLSPPARPFVFALYGEDPSVSLPRHGETLHGELRRAGYRTGLFYSSFTNLWHARAILDLAPFDALEDADTMIAAGVPRNAFGVDDRTTAQRALAWLSGLDRSRPFGLVYWSVETHLPYTWLGMPDAVRQADPYARYRAGLERADAIFGEFYDGLARTGLAEDTLIVVVGDHGQGLGRPPRPWDLSHSFRVFEDDIHVPLLFLHPAFAPAPGQQRARVATVVTHADIFPTLLDLLGLPAARGLDGSSLARDYPVHPSFSRSLLWWPVALRAGRYKLMLSRAGGPAALYDTAADTLEEHDLMSAQPEIGQLLLSELYRWHARRFLSDPSFGYQMRLPPNLPTS